MSDEDDIPQLSAETFAALQAFYKEEECKQEKLENLQQNVIFNEDWQLSQFWYDKTTINTLVKVALKTVGPSGKIALVSCPTLYKKMRQDADHNSEVTLFEYDDRFAAYGPDFVLYDYKAPLDVPKDRSSYYDLVIADPPFLSEECLTKTAVTIKYLTKGRIILCTGAIMAELALKLLDLKKSAFEPKHQNNLANEFCCYTNYNIDEFL